MDLVEQQKGSITVLALIIMLFLTLMATGLAIQIRAEVKNLTLAEQKEAAQYVAEAGINAALAEIMNHPQDFRNAWEETLENPAQSHVDIVIDKSGSIYYIKSDGVAYGIHQKLSASIVDYPGKVAKVLIQNGFANP